MATTEITLRSGTALQVSEDFAERFPSLAPDPEMLALLEENLGDDEVSVGSFGRVKVPAGGGTTWELNVGGESVFKKEITGVIVAWSARRSFWVSQNPDGSAPDCSSSNNKTPDAGGLFAPGGEREHENPTGLCANCPMSQMGSDLKSGVGSACREQRLMFVTPEGALFPLVVTVPRTSIKNFKQFMFDMINVSKPYYSVEVGLTLVEAVSSGGNKYAKIALRKVRDLEPGEVIAAKEYGKQISDLVSRVVSDHTDGATEQQPPADSGGVSFETEEVMGS